MSFGTNYVTRHDIDFSTLTIDVSYKIIETQIDETKFKVLIKQTKKT